MINVFYYYLQNHIRTITICFDELGGYHPHVHSVTSYEMHVILVSVWKVWKRTLWTEAWRKNKLQTLWQILSEKWHIQVFSMTTLLRIGWTSSDKNMEHTSVCVWNKMPRCYMPPMTQVYSGKQYLMLSISVFFSSHTDRLTGHSAFTTVLKQAKEKQM